MEEVIQGTVGALGNFVATLLPVFLWGLLMAIAFQGIRLISSVVVEMGGKGTPVGMTQAQANEILPTLPPPPAHASASKDSPTIGGWADDERPRFAEYYDADGRYIGPSKGANG